MRGKIAKKWSNMAIAAGIAGASFGVSATDAGAQYFEYNRNQCPVIDTDFEITALKMGYVNAINSFRTNNALPSGYVCPEVRSMSYSSGVERAKNCVDDFMAVRANVGRRTGSFKYQPFAPSTMRDVQREVERGTDRCFNQLFYFFPNNVMR